MVSVSVWPPIGWYGHNGLYIPTTSHLKDNVPFGSMGQLYNVCMYNHVQEHRARSQRQASRNPSMQLTDQQARAVVLDYTTKELVFSVCTLLN